MKRRTLILIILAVVLIVAAFISLLLEKKEVENELNEFLNGKQPDDTDKTIQPGSGGGIEPETT